MNGLASPARPLVRVETRSGRISVWFEDRDDVRVEGAQSSREIRESDAELHVRSNQNVELRVPIGTNLTIGSISGHVQAKGDGGDIRVSTASSSIEIDHAHRADLRSISGAISIRSSGACRLSTKSGRVEAGRVTNAQVTTVSGRIHIASADGKVEIKTVSGRVDVGAAGREDVLIHTISGSTTVRMPAGTRPEVRLKSLAGHTRSDFSAGSDCRVAVSTLSGRIELVDA